jgi:hypothetical protein
MAPSLRAWTSRGWRHSACGRILPSLVVLGPPHVLVGGHEGELRMGLGGKGQPIEAVLEDGADVAVGAGAGGAGAGAGGFRAVDAVALGEAQEAQARAAAGPRRSRCVASWPPAVEHREFVAARRGRHSTGRARVPTTAPRGASPAPAPAPGTLRNAGPARRGGRPWPREATLAHDQDGERAQPEGSTQLRGRQLAPVGAVETEAPRGEPGVDGRVSLH